MPIRLHSLVLTALLTGTLSLLHAPTLGAQQVAQLSEGTLVRINGLCRPSPQIRVRSGQLARAVAVGPLATSDTLWVRTSSRVWAMPQAEVYTVETGRGRSRWRSALKGAGIGAAAGGLVLGMIVGSTFSTSDGDYLGSRGAATFVGAFIGAVYGAPIGGVIGALSGGEHWSPVTASGHCR